MEKAAIPDVLRLNDKLSRSSRYFLGAGIFGVVLCIVSYFQDGRGFFASYLTAFCFFLALALGALFFVMVQHLARASWSVTVRRTAETLAFNLWIMAPLLLPLLIAAWTGDLFVWTNAEVRATDHLVKMKIAYLNLPFLTIRAVGYFAVWMVLSRWFLFTSRRQDESGDPTLTLKMSKVAAGGLILYGLTQSFFAFDWMMSLDPHWFSTMFGVYYFAGSVVAFYCVLILITALLRKTGHVRTSINIEHFHDMGKLLFGHNVFWTYIAFSQFMLIWYANIPEETLWFLHRSEGSWKTVSLILPWCHFAIPFLFLMSHNVKRHAVALPVGSAWLLAICYVDIYWLIQPYFHPHGAHFGLSDVGSLLTVGGFFIFFLLKNLRQANLIPVKDPRLGQCLSYDNGIVE